MLAATGPKGMGTLSVYIDKWLQTASRNNVLAAFAFATDRVAFGCKVCKASYSFPTPASANEMDYGAQEFVKLHRHEGGHGDVLKKCDTCDVTFRVPSHMSISVKSRRCEKCRSMPWMTIPDPPAIPVTADFKKIEARSSDVLRPKTGRRFR